MPSRVSTARAGGQVPDRLVRRVNGKSVRLVNRAFCRLQMRKCARCSDQDAFVVFASMARFD